MEQSNRQKNYDRQLSSLIESQVKKFLGSSKHRRVDRVHIVPMAPLNYFCQAMEKNQFELKSSEYVGPDFKYVFTKGQSEYHITGSLVSGNFRICFIK